jgi:hypothetical protein
LNQRSINQIQFMSSNEPALAGLGQNLNWFKKNFILNNIYILFWGFII